MREPVAHQAYPGRMLTHRQYVAYLRRSAEQWAVQPNGREQVQRVTAEANRLQREGIDGCGVCRAAGAR